MVGVMGLCSWVHHVTSHWELGVSGGFCGNGSIQIFHSWASLGNWLHQEVRSFLCVFQSACPCSWCTLGTPSVMAPACAWSPVSLLGLCWLLSHFCRRGKEGTVHSP